MKKYKVKGITLNIERQHFLNESNYNYRNYIEYIGKILEAEIYVYMDGSADLWSPPNFKYCYSNLYELMEVWDLLDRRVIIEKTGCL